jgi:ankyrin repeat protein
MKINDYFHLASNNSYIDIVNLLLKRNASINIQDDRKYTALESGLNFLIANLKNEFFKIYFCFKASKFNRTDIVRALTNAGADVNIADYDGDTSLIWGKKIFEVFWDLSIKVLLKQVKMVILISLNY